MRTIISLGFMISLCLLNGFGQDIPMYFNHLNRDNGISSNRVNCIYEDRNGFMWFGTEEGLNRFDGYSFTIFRNDPENEHSIISNTVDAMVEERTHGNLIIATNKGLVSRDPSTGVFKTIFNEELDIPPGRDHDLTSLLVDSLDGLWVGTRHGLFHFDLVNQKLVDYYPGNDTTYASLKSPYISTLELDNKGRIWIGHEDGIDILDPGTGKFEIFRPDIPIQYVESVFFDSDNGLWIGSDVSGLYHFPDIRAKEYYHYSVETGDFIENRVHGVVETREGVFFIIVRDGGLYLYNKIEDRFYYYKPDIYDPGSINSKAVISIYKSSQGIVWIGTYNSGVNYIDNKRKNFGHYRVNFKEDGLFNNNIRALCEDSDGYIWIGTKEEGGLSRFDRKSNTFKHYKKSEEPGGLKDDYIFSICEMDPANLLIGTIRNGLAVFNKKTERFSYYINDRDDPESLSHNRVYFIFKDSERRIWVGNNSELQEFHPSSGTFKTVVGIRSPKCIIEESEESLWIGTRAGGIYLYNKASGNLVQYQYEPGNPGSIPGNDIYSIKKDKNGILWIGTKDGLSRMEPSTGNIKNYQQKEGLPANWICGLEIDDSNNIWVSTTNGISKFSPDKNTFHNYDIRDGLQGNEFEGFVSLKTSNGDIIFGGRNGFNMFTPSSITNNTDVPKIVLTDFKLYNKEVVIGAKDSPLQKHISQTSNLKLKHNQSAITLGYTALNFTSPEKNQYTYILEGFDDEWINAGTNRIAVYTNIPPGEYTFRVTGSNNDGIWNHEGASLAIEVMPPPWKTDLAYFIYIVTLLFIFIAIRKILIMRIEEKKLIEFERKDKERIKELNQLKLRFFTNISHEFRTPLTLISGPLEKLLSFRDENEEKQYLLKVMRNNVKRMLFLINELMEFRKAENEKLKLHVSRQDTEKFIHEVVNCFEEFANSKNISIEINYKLDKGKEYWFDKSLIDKILFNLMSNALKYSYDGGRVTIDLDNKDQFIEISVSDTGKGIAKNELDAIFQRFYQVEDNNQVHLGGTGIGLAFSNRLIEAHHGSIEAESVINAGSRFTIRFPADKNLFSEQELFESDVIPKKESEFHGTTLPGKKSTEAAADIHVNSKKILIVEDNDELRSYLVNYFSDNRIYEAADGKSGIKIAFEELPDIIISDVMMPGADGIELCAKVKTEPATSHIPVILLSAKTETEFKIKGIDTGADAYIDKPFEMDYLKAVVKNLFKQREGIKKRIVEEPAVNLQELSLTSHEKKFIEKTRKVIENNLENPDFSVEAFGEELGLSRSQLFRKFKSLYDQKPSELIRNERLKKAKALLATREFNINEVAYQTGFKSSSYFITSFKKYFGETPNEYYSRIKQ